MCQLSKVPAFGFESFKCFAKPHLPEPIKNTLPLHDLINDSNWIEGTANKVKASVVKQNTLKALSYIPGVSFGIGIYHLHAARTNKQFSAYFIFRGVLELLGLSFLLLLPDLIMKCYRDQKAQKEFHSKVTFVESYEDHISKLVQERLKAPVKAMVESDPQPQPVEATTPPEPESIPAEPVKEAALIEEAKPEEPEPVYDGPLFFNEEKMAAYLAETKRYDQITLADIKHLVNQVKTELAATKLPSDANTIFSFINQGLFAYFQSDIFEEKCGWRAFKALADENGGHAMPGVAYEYYQMRTAGYVKALIYTYLYACDPQVSLNDFAKICEKHTSAYSDAVAKMFSIKDFPKQELYSLLDKVGPISSNNFAAISNVLNKIKEVSAPEDYLTNFDSNQANYFTSPWFEMRCHMMVAKMQLQVAEDPSALKNFMDATAWLITGLTSKFIKVPASDPTFDFDAFCQEHFKEYGMSFAKSLPKNMAGRLQALENHYKFSGEMKAFVDAGLVSLPLYNALCDLKQHYWYFPRLVVQGIIEGMISPVLADAGCSLIMDKKVLAPIFAALPFECKSYDQEAINKNFAFYKNALNSWHVHNLTL